MFIKSDMCEFVLSTACKIHERDMLLLDVDGSRYYVVFSEGHLRDSAYSYICICLFTDTEMSLPYVVPLWTTPIDTDFSGAVVSARGGESA